MAKKCPKCHSDNPGTATFCADCGTQLPSIEDIEVTETMETPKEELTTGSTFVGRYQIIEELGKGGMGRVYRVLDKQLNEEIAIKLIKPDIGSDKKTIERFRNELKIARKIVQKNIGRMFDLNEDKGTYYITMEYVSGQDLKGLIRQSGQLAIGTTISIAKQICDGLVEAHKLGVVHRDLKPGNIMIDKEGTVRIMDFGIARSLEEKGITGAGVMIGTPEYMSPEQVEAKEVDQRSDIYSFGIIMYEMLTGRLPFEADTPFAVGVKHKSEKPTDPKEYNSQISDDLNRLILKCLEKEKENRYQSAADVKSELERIEKGLPTTEKAIPKKKPLTSKEITVQFNLKKILLPALAVAVLAIMAVLLWRFLPKKELILAPSGKPSLAIMYFKNNTGEEGLDHLRTMLCDLLIADLSQSTYIKVLSMDRLFSILKSLNQLEAKTYSTGVLKQVAEKSGADHILQGTYAKAGDKIRINIMLQDIDTGELISSEGAEGEGEESIFPMVDDLTRRIKSSFRLSAAQIASDYDEEAGKITTSSAEAYKFYVEGRKYHNEGDHPKNIELMKKALDIDPEFAMAYRSLGIAYSNLGYSKEGKKYIQKALELTGRLSERERYAIQGDFYTRSSEKTYGKAIEAYSKLLNLYPEDRIGNVNLGVLYMSLEEWDKAIELYNVLIQSKDESYFAYYNTANAYNAKGMYDKAFEILQNYLEEFSDSYVIRWQLALNYFSLGNYELAFKELDKAISMFPTWYLTCTKGDFYFYRGDFLNAQKEYQKIFESKEDVAHWMAKIRLAVLCQSLGQYDQAKEHLRQSIELAMKKEAENWEASSRLQLALIYRLKGDMESALKEYKRISQIGIDEEELNYQRLALWGKSLSYLEMEAIDNAQRAANELDTLIQEGMNKKLLRLFYSVKGRIEFKNGNFSGAIDYFDKALDLLPSQSDPQYDRHALFLNPLAIAYYKSGNLDAARKEYEKITRLTSGRLFHGDIYTKSFYMLGKIYEEQGDTAKAIEHYEKFLDLWKDADPGIAEVEDAKKRLAGLKK